MKTKKLYRSSSNKMIAGICGGLEEFTGVDATIWRLIFVLLLLPGGIPGLLLYAIMWVIVPQQGDNRA